MPLANYIVEFIEMHPADAIARVKDGFYSASELESLSRNEKRIAVASAINEARPKGFKLTAGRKKKTAAKKEVPEIVEQFWELSGEEQVRAVNVGSYDDHLVILKRHSQLGMVYSAINQRIRELNTTSVAVVEKGKSDTMSLLLPVAAHINEKFTRFQTVEKEATMIMLEVGLMLEAVKEQLPHGQLQKWIAENLTISYRHAKRFRELATEFIKANSLKNDECLLLCDPANSQEALGEKLRQMAFDFLGDKTQAELFEQYKIKYQEPKKLTYHPPKGGGDELPDGETKEHFIAKSTWDEIGGMLNTHGLSTESWANLNDAERQSLYDIVHELDRRLKASLKK